MSIKSTNLNLNLTDTASETTTDFQSWRRALDGTGYDNPSNMEIIDAFAAETKAALASKVPNSYGQDQANKVLATDENGNVVLKNSTGGGVSGGVTTEELEQALRTKVSVDQGIDNAGKVLSVGDDGKVILSDSINMDLTGYVKTDEMNSALDTKLSIQQGTENSGKFLSVGDDGNIGLNNQPVLDEEEVNTLIDKKVKLLVATSENDFGGITYIFDVASENIQSKEEIEIEG